MVPWHPPCALISLIFSSLDPETNWSTSYCEIRFPLPRFLVSASSPHYSVATGLFKIILCAVVKVHRQLRCFSFSFALLLDFFFNQSRNRTWKATQSAVQFSLSRTLKTIQNFFRKLNRIPIDAVRLADSSFPSSAAELLFSPCCPVTAPCRSTFRFAFLLRVSQPDRPLG